MALRATRFTLTERFSKSSGDQKIFDDNSDRSQSVLMGTSNLYRQSTPLGFKSGYRQMRLSYGRGARFSGPGLRWRIPVGGAV